MENFIKNEGIIKELVSAPETFDVIDTMIKAGVTELKSYRADLTDEQARNILLMNLEMQYFFPRIIASEDAKEILMFALKYPLNADYFNQIQNRLIALGDIDVLCNFAIEFQDKIDVDQISQKLLTNKSILTVNAKKNFIAKVRNIPFKNKFKLFLETSYISKSLDFVALVDYSTRMLSVQEKSNIGFINHTPKLIADAINEVAKSSEEEFNLNIEMFTAPLSKSFISELNDLIYSLYISLDDLPDTITLDELYRSNKVINDINNDMGIVERLNEARKNRFSFKPGEAGQVEHSRTGASRTLSNNEII